jgi:nucleoside-diphosphate-sugar epimerase
MICSKVSLTTRWRSVIDFSRLSGIQGFIHLASTVGGISDLDLALDIGKRAGINALTACAKTPSVKRFVNTSSSVAVSLPKIGLDHEFPVDESTYNDEAMDLAKEVETGNRIFLVYAAMKSETEKAMWAWMKENNPSFVMNSIVSIPTPFHIPLRQD